MGSMLKRIKDMNIYIKYFSLFVISFFITLPAQGRVTYNYTTLIFLDYEQLSPIVKNSVRESRAFKYPQQGDKALEPLIHTLGLLHSRPDNDGLLKKLLPPVINELMSLNAFEKAVEKLINSAQAEVDNSELVPKIRTTALIRLNNLLRTVRPLTLENIELAKQVCKLADTNTKIPIAVKRDSRLTTMFNSTKPSDLAKKIMLWYAEKKGREDLTKNSKGCPYSKRA